MRKVLAWLTSVTMMLVSTGCFQQEMEFTLNPDGSGKVTINTTKSAAANPFGGKQKGNPEELAKKAAQKVVESAKGVDAWKDVSWTVGKDGNATVTATAYFKSLKDLQLAGSQMDILYRKAGKGVELVVDEKEKKANPSEEKAEEPAKKLSPEEIKAKAKQEQAQFQQMLPMMGMFMNNLKMDAKFNLPGTVNKAVVFKKEGKNAVRLTIDGAKMLAAMQELATNDKFWEEAAKGGRNIQKDGPGMDILMEKMFGVKGIPQATTADAKPQFDYAKEVAAAKKAFPALKTKLGIE